VAGVDAESNELTAAIAAARATATGPKVDVSTISTGAAPAIPPRQLADRFDQLVSEFMAEGLEEWEATDKAQDILSVEVAEAEAAAPKPEPEKPKRTATRPRKTTPYVEHERLRLAHDTLERNAVDRFTELSAAVEALGADVEKRNADVDEMLTVIAKTIRELRAAIPAPAEQTPMLVIHDGSTYKESEARVRSFYGIDGDGDLLAPPERVGKIRGFFRWLW
jgi:hypothetical protein